VAATVARSRANSRRSRNMLPDATTHLSLPDEHFQRPGPATTTVIAATYSVAAGPSPAGFGLGVRLVVLIAAAHALRVAHIWPARAGRRFIERERLKKGLLCSK